jgi:benzodiazapine receptor
MTIDMGVAVLVVAFTAAMAVLGTVLAGDALKTWFPTLVRPTFQMPLPLFVGVGIIGYIVGAIVLYRLLTVVDDSSGRIVCVAAMVVTMLYNELWNGALFRLRSPLAGFVLVVAFLAPLAILEIALVLFEPVSALLIGVYVLWVIVYDVPWSYRLWRLNQDR